MEVETTPLESTGKVTAVDANVDYFDFTDGVYTLRPQELNRLYGKVKHYCTHSKRFVTQIYRHAIPKLRCHRHRGFGSQENANEQGS